MSAIVDKFSATIAVRIDSSGGVTFGRFGAKALLEAGRGVADPNKRDVFRCCADCAGLIRVRHCQAHTGAGPLFPKKITQLIPSIVVDV
jgi:hypothetical protein